MANRKGIIASLWDDLKNNGLGHDWHVKADMLSQFLQLWYKRKGGSHDEVVRETIAQSTRPSAWHTPGTLKCLFICLSQGWPLCLWVRLG